MRIPKIRGIIRRRFLINFRIDPAVLAKLLPAPFAPLTHGGHALGGICLIRLENIRPQPLPDWTGISSENAAHRFAVKWPGGEGVYIPRRDTDSMLNHLAGGRIFPGRHHRASFAVQESQGNYRFSMTSQDQRAGISFVGRPAAGLPADSCFDSLRDAVDFFEAGSIGYSPAQTSQEYDGLQLKTPSWNARAFEIENVDSLFFADSSNFPAGSIEFDHALLLENLEHEWHSMPPISTAG